ncbi:MAG: hypothetical protein HXX16_12065 [Bacteroidales bacterium]|nr:hypothetical protein [Bacteroidales bacterium]
MKRKLLIVSASVIVFAFIVAIGIHAQSEPNTKNTNTEQTEKKVPEKCKQCPNYSKCVEANKCLEANSQKDTTASACQSKCKEKKSCTGSCEHKDMKKCDNTKACPQSSECKKKCGKK